MKTYLNCVKGLLLIGLLIPVISWGNSEATSEQIGTYDSRAIAVAFAGSPAHQKQMQELMEAHRQAVAAGDKDAIAAIKTKAQALQKQLTSKLSAQPPLIIS